MKSRIFDTISNYILNLKSIFIHQFDDEYEYDEPLTKLSELQIAVRAKDKVLVNSLLKKGADVNSASIYGSTEIFTVCENGDLDIATLLINYGANLNLRAVSILIEDQIVDFRKFSNNNYELLGHTPLTLSIMLNQYAISELLLKNGANVNNCGELNLTPLRFAVSGECSESFVKLLISYNADINLRDDDSRTAFDQINDLSVKEQLKPYFDLAQAIDHLVAGKDTITEENKRYLSNIEDAELLEVAAKRLKISYMSKNDYKPVKLTQKYINVINDPYILKSIEKEYCDAQVSKFINKILIESKKHIKDEELTAKFMLEEIAQLESVLLTAKIYRAAGENEKKILTYDTLRTALEFNSNRDRAGVGVADDSGGVARLAADVISADKGLGTKVDVRAGAVKGTTGTAYDSPEIKAYKEMLAIYDANPNYKKVGYILQEANGNFAELKKTFTLLTGEDKADFAAHLSNLLAKEPEIFLDEAKEALCELCGGVDITHESLQEFTENHDAHEPHATYHHTEDHHLPADNLELAGNAAGVGLAAVNHD